MPRVPAKKKPASKPPQEQDFARSDISEYGEIATVDINHRRGADPFINYNPDKLSGRKGLKIYREIRTDEQVKAALQAKKSAVLASGWKIEQPESENIDDEQAGMMQRFVEFSLSEMDLPKLDTVLMNMLTALDFGFSVNEPVYHYVDYGEFEGFDGLKTIKTRDPIGFEFETDSWGNLTDTGVVQNGIHLPADRLAVYTYRPEFSNFYGTSDLRETYRPWFGKNNLLKFMMIGLERYGEPVAVATAKKRLTAPEKANLRQMFDSLQSRTLFIVPDFIELDFKQPQRDTGQQYATIFEKLDTWIRLSILMPGLIGMAGESPVGSFARAGKEFDTFLLVVEQLRNELAAVLNDRVLKPLQDMNFEINDGKYALFKFLAITAEQKQKIFSLFVEGLGKNAVSKLVEDENHLRELIDFPKMPDEKLEELREEEEQRKEDADLIRQTRQRQAIEGQGNGEDENNQEGNAKESYKQMLAELPVETRKALLGRDWILTPEEKDEIKTRLHQRRALTVYEKRVDFESIEQGMGNIAVQTDTAIRQQLRIVRNDTVKQVSLIYPSLTPANATSFLIKTGQPIVDAMKHLLLEGWQQGVVEAAKELPTNFQTAIPKIFSKWLKRFAGFQPTQAMRFLEGRALNIAGVLDDTLTNKVRQKLIQQLKGGKSLQEMIDDVRRIFEPWVGDPTKIAPSGQVGLGFPPGEKAPENVLMAYRLENMIRTPLTEAINEGRKTMADEAGDYVVGFQYSAVLDTRTTEICRGLDQIMIRKDDARVQALTPPSHYQCRSLWVFITTDDLPVQWSSEAELDRAVRLVPEEFQ